MKTIRLNNKFNFFKISDSIPGVGGGKSEEDEVSKEDQVTVIIRELVTSYCYS